jgi:hypothetical protein
MQINIKYSADKLTDMIDWSLSALIVYLFTQYNFRPSDRTAKGDHFLFG